MRTGRCPSTGRCSFLFDDYSMKRLAVLVGLAIPMLSSAQSVDVPYSAPVVTTSGAFFALSVANIEASTRWYREKLGLSVTMRAARTDATKSAMTLLQGGGLTVELVQHDEAAPLRNFLPAPRGALFLHGIFKV